MFQEEREDSSFQWTMLGDIDLGRANLGQTTTVTVYRLMQYTLRDVLLRKYGAETADRLYFEAGKLAGFHFCENLLTRDLPFPAFAGQLQEVLKNLRVGILRIEKVDLEQYSFTVTVAEDLDCSGLPVRGEQICTYDEGFFAGLLEAYTRRGFTVKEVDCWCSGDRVCRFEAKPALR